MWFMLNIMDYRTLSLLLLTTCFLFFTKNNHKSFLSSRLFFSLFTNNPSHISCAEDWNPNFRFIIEHFKHRTSLWLENIQPFWNQALIGIVDVYRRSQIIVIWFRFRFIYKSVSLSSYWSACQIYSRRQYFISSLFNRTHSPWLSLP